ncbi:hypothetical protein ABIF00_000450 [Bradyrhizobium elkanii]
MLKLSLAESEPSETVITKLWVVLAFSALIAVLFGTKV